MLLRPLILILLSVSLHCNGTRLSLKIPNAMDRAKKHIAQKQHFSKDNVKLDVTMAPMIALYLGSSKMFQELTIDLQHSYTWVTKVGADDPGDLTGFDPKKLVMKAANDKSCNNYIAKHNFMNSTTFVNLKTKFKDSAHNDFGFSGEISGEYVKDDLWDSVFTSAPLIAGAEFAMATKVYYHFEYELSQGRFGLAIPGNSLQSWLQPNYLGAGNTFTIRIATEGYLQGSVMFGGLDNFCDNSSVVRVEATTSDWKFSVNGLSYMNYSSPTGKIAAWDSVSELTGLPEDVYNAVYKLSGAFMNPEYTQPLVDCYKDRFPDITIRFKFEEVTFPEEAYIFRNTYYNYCMFLLYPTKATGFHPAYIFGYPFMQNKCVQFEWANDNQGTFSFMNAGNWTNVHM